MAKTLTPPSTRKERVLPEWTTHILRLRRHLKMSQAELGNRLNCSAMTISRWERGQQPPSAKAFIQLGKLAGKNDLWFFWERAGLQMSDVERASPNRRSAGLSVPRTLTRAHAGAAAGVSPAKEVMVALPLLKAAVATLGEQGDRAWSLERIPATKMLGAPAEWCPNPRYTSLLHVKGHSMEPMINDGDIVAVDSRQNDRSELDGKVVIVSSEEKGLCVSRLRHFGAVDVLESANQECKPIVLTKDSGWRIVGRVLWWISAAP